MEAISPYRLLGTPFIIIVCLKTCFLKRGNNAGAEGVSVMFFPALTICFDLLRGICFPCWLDGSYVPLSKSDEKLKAEKIIQGIPQQLDYHN